jgi:hypothetical protein
MQNSSYYLPGFHLSTLRSKPRSEREKLAEEQDRLRRHSLSGLGDSFGSFIPIHEVAGVDASDFSRRRVYSKENTFWAFFSQVLDADGGCQEAVRKVQAVAASRDLSAPSSSTAAYCQARQKLSATALQAILTHTAENLQQRRAAQGWHGHRVVVVDGTGLSMPDTPANQAHWPQPRNQKPGCGFPQARVCACFCLQTGALLSHRVGSRKNHELPLLRQQWETFRSGDIFLGDKGFCSFYDVWEFQQRQVDSVITLARRTPVKAAEAVRVLGSDDLLIRWPKPAWNKKLSYSKAQWQVLPKHLELRQIKVTVAEPGFRTQSYYLVTTLTDPIRYPAEDLAKLYRQRWDVELFFRDIKTTLGMDVLRCRTPEMVTKEILMHLIVYNALRSLIFDAAREADQPVRRISFKAGLQALRQWEPWLNQPDLKPPAIRQQMAALRATIASAITPDRPRRQEPRCVKRRPKPYQLMVQPRHKMEEIKHRNRYRAEQA